MHCGYINKNSAIALPEIIKYYKDNGYTFKSIDEDTSEMFHYITASYPKGIVVLRPCL